MDDKKKIIENLTAELRRGTLVISVLINCLNPIYGYSLVQKLQTKKVDVDKNTLYPLLRRLDKQELLTSFWDTSENRARKYYQTSELGNEVLHKLLVEWKKINVSIESMIEEL
ncbi:MAG: PadR family transcriptional regulator [Pleomorphochaeta sp.]